MIFVFVSFFDVLDEIVHSSCSFDAGFHGDGSKFEEKVSPRL